MNYISFVIDRTIISKYFEIDRGSSANGIRGSGAHFLAFDLIPSVVDNILLNIESSVGGIPAKTTVAHSTTIAVSSHEWLDIII